MSSWSLLPTPRQWQLEALDKWMTSNCRGIAQVVTGAGKTVFAEICMNAFRTRNPDARYVIVVPTSALLDQWYVSLGEDLGLSAGDIATFSGEGIPNSPSLVNLMVINTARKYAARLLNKKTMLVVDECHRAASPSNASLFSDTPAASLGLSATPHRDYDDGLEEILVPSLGPVIYEYSYRRALEERIISPYSVVNVEIPLMPTERDEYDRLTKRLLIAVRKRATGEVSDEAVKRILMQRAGVSNGASMRVPVAAKIVEQHHNGRSIVFHEKIDAAEEIRDVLQSRGLRVCAYHSRLGPAMRRDNIRQFRLGRFDVLVTCRALDEGMNVPEADVAVIASGSAASRQRVQRFGRVLRPSPGKQTACIYTLYATAPEKKRLEQEASRLEGSSSVSWLSTEKKTQ